MKNPVPPGVVVAILIVVAIILVVFGMRYFRPGGAGSTTNPYERMPSGVNRPSGSGGYTGRGSMGGGPSGGMPMGSGGAPRGTMGGPSSAGGQPTGAAP